MAFLFLPNRLSQQARYWSPFSPLFVYFLYVLSSSPSVEKTLYVPISPQYLSLALSLSLVTRLVYETPFLVISACLFNRHFTHSQSRILDFYLLQHILFFQFSHLRKWHPHSHLDGSHSLLTGLLLPITVCLQTIFSSTASEISEKHKSMMFLP